MTDVRVALVTIDSLENAKKLARAAVQQGLAACANIVPGLTSVYFWQGEMQEDGECLLVIKTREARIADLQAFVLASHPYSNPEFIVLPVESGSGKYLDWVRGMSGG